MPIAKRLIIFALVALTAPLFFYAVVVPLLMEMERWGIMLVIYLAGVALITGALGAALVWALRPLRKPD